MSPNSPILSSKLGVCISSSMTTRPSSLAIIPITLLTHSASPLPSTQVSTASGSAQLSSTSTISPGGVILQTGAITDSHAKNTKAVAGGVVGGVVGLALIFTLLLLLLRFKRSKNRSNVDPAELEEGKKTAGAVIPRNDLGTGYSNEKKNGAMDIGGVAVPPSLSNDSGKVDHAPEIHTASCDLSAMEPALPLPAVLSLAACELHSDLLNSSAVVQAKERRDPVLLSPSIISLLNSSPSREQNEIPTEPALRRAAISAEAHEENDARTSLIRSDILSESYEEAVYFTPSMEFATQELERQEVVLIDMSATAPRPKIVLAFDVGTTYSGISYSIETFDNKPAIKGVVRLLGQEENTGDSKIPTIIYYDRQGKVRVIGAEATAVGIEKAARDGKWFKSEWFKLHLRSQVGNGKNLAGQIPPLPPRKTVVDVFADYLRYLFNCAEKYIQKTHPDEAGIWTTHRDETHFVLSHPNGWEGKEQSQMRVAAIKARLIPDTPAGKSRVSFVTEGESSLHLVVDHKAFSQNEEVKSIIIVDAGGGTIDISTYGRDDEGGDRTFKEISVAECHYSGSAFVTMTARLYLEDFLKGSKFHREIEKITRCFDQTTKLTFKDINEPQYIKFGTANDNDPSYSIRGGCLELPGTTVAKFFQPSVNSIVNALRDLQRSAHGKITHVVIVGGFSANDWLFNKVRTSVNGQGLIVIRPENDNETVFNGPISSYVDHYVRSRVVKVTYGEFASVGFDNTKSEHRQRARNRYTDIEGIVNIPNAFHIILRKNAQISETKEFRQSFYQVWEVRETRQRLHSDVWCYRGALKNPGWKDVDEANYTKLCTLTTPLSHLPVRRLRNPSGETYHRVDYEIILLPGLTELHAQLAWQENGKEKRSRAELVYDYDS